jgi:DNA mismatch repair protein MutS2
VVEAARGGRYRVRVEGLTVWCREEDLADPPDAPKGRRAGRRPPAAPAADPPDDAAPPGRVDLHGLRVDEAIARAVQEMDRTIRRGADRLEVVHGKGSGRIRDALHRQLGSMPVVKAFALDPRNPGVTWVYF